MTPATPSRERSLPIVALRLRGPFGPSLYIRFGQRTSLIIKRTRAELFSERNGHRPVHRFMGWTWRWQPIQAATPPVTTEEPSR